MNDTKLTTYAALTPTDMPIGHIDHQSIVRNLELTIGQVARLADVSVRQIAYWTDKGILTASNPRKRIYDYDALQKAILISQHLKQGESLHDALEQVESSLVLKQAENQTLADLNEDRLVYYMLSKLDDIEEMCRRLRARLPALRQNGNLREAHAMLTKLEVLSFFAQNPTSRDTAQWLAVQLGRDVALVTQALEELTQSNVIEKTQRGARTFYQTKRISGGG